MFGRVWPLYTESKQMQTYSINIVSNGTILAIKQELLFTNVAPIQNITEIICVIGFFVNTAPLFHSTVPFIFS